MSQTNANIQPTFRSFVFLTIIILVGIPSSASAQTQIDRAKEKAAKTACLAGEVKKGITLLAELYGETNEATYIYNQGRCYQQNDQPKLALSRFREYLRKEPQMTPREKAATEKNIHECETELAQINPPAAIPTAQTEATAASTSFKDATQNPGHGMRFAGVVTSIAGLSALGAAVTLHLIRSKMVDTLYKEGETWSEKKASNLDRYRTLSQIGYGVAALALATGVTLYLIGSQAEKKDGKSNLSLLPTLMPGEASVKLCGVF